MPNLQPDATPEAVEARRALVRESVARHKERQSSLSRLEQAAWKERATLGAQFDPYTPAEREKLARIRALQDELEKEAGELRQSVVARLGAAGAESPLASLLERLESGKGLRIELAPF